MRLKTALTHTVLPKRRYLRRSFLLASLFFLLFNGITLWVVHQANERQQQRLAQDVRNFTVEYLAALRENMAQMGDMTRLPCDMTQASLTQRAAFTRGVRTFLLVRDGEAYCSSAMGAISRQVAEIYPALRLQLPQDMALQPGTVMVPEKPAIGVWLATPGEAQSGVLATLDITVSPYLIFSRRYGGQGRDGMAIMIGDYALTNFSASLLKRAALTDKNAHDLPVPGTPAVLRFYSQSLTTGDVQVTLLAGLLLASLLGALSYYLQRARHSAGHEMVEAMRQRQFHMVYQPVIETRSQQVAGVEALMRWHHPTEGAIPPDVFITYAENQGLIVPLTRHLFRLIAQDAIQLQTILPVGAKLAVNLSPAHLSDPHFERDVLHFLNRLPAHHFNVVFEITERGMVAARDAQHKFDWLRAQQIEIAIDDFGTGHSALIYLEQFNLDYLKIDRGFITAIGRQTVTAPVLDTVLNLTQELGLKTVAEGVETPQQAHYLRERGVTYLQGYLYSRPLALDALRTFVAGYRP